MAQPGVLIVGLRNQGRAHVPAFSRDDRVDVAICDVNPGEVREVGELHRIPMERRFGGPTGYTEALRKRPRLVVLATPTHTHRKLAAQAAAAGADILSEKPLEVNTEEARALLDEVRAHGRRIWVGFHMRYMHDAVSTVLANQGLGVISTIQLEWVRLVGRPPVGPHGFPGGPIVSDLGSHKIDLALWWLRHPPVRYVAGIDAQPLPNTTLYDRYGGLVVCRTRQQVALNMSYVSAIATAERASVRVIGDRGEVFAPLMTARDDVPERFLPTLNGVAFGVPFDSAVLGRTVPPRNPMECFAAQARDVVTAVLGGDAPTLCTGEDAFEVVKVVDGLAASADSLAPVMFDDAGGAAG